MLLGLCISACTPATKTETKDSASAPAAQSGPKPDTASAPVDNSPAPASPTSAAAPEPAGETTAAGETTGGETTGGETTGPGDGDGEAIDPNPPETKKPAAKRKYGAPRPDPRPKKKYGAPSPPDELF